MTKIYTLTLAPSLDSATLTPQMYPKENSAAAHRFFEPGGGGINVARAITFLGGKATAIYPAGGATGEHLTALLTAEQVPVEPVEAQDWTRQNLHVHVAPAANNIALMPGRLNGRGVPSSRRKGSGDRDRLTAGGKRQPAAWHRR
jgi:6-phosphofructokinase 2